MEHRPSGYVHGYDQRESARLHDQAESLETLLHADTYYPTGARVLEVGCGVGAQTVPLARRSPTAHFVALDVSADSVAAAAKRVHEAGLKNVEFAQGDIFDLPFGPASFDHIFVCFVLEHLPDPSRALRILRPLLRPKGTIAVIEGDHGTTCFHPDSAAGRAAVDALIALQRAAGGDANIGRRLFPLLQGAGYESVQVRPRTVYADGSRPELAESFTRRTFTAMIEGIGGHAVAAGLIQPSVLEDGISALRRSAEHDGAFYYTFFKAVAKAEAI